MFQNRVNSSDTGYSIYWQLSQLYFLVEFSYQELPEILDFLVDTVPKVDGSSFYVEY
ncbi:MAG: hypothetical protein ABFS56_20590 [Pseudomonadota bacterium]